MYPGSESFESLRRLVPSFIAGVLMVCVSPTQAATNVTHWAFQPLVRPAVPASKYSNGIDAFVSSSLKSKGHKLAAEADRQALIRRLSFDLRGLPPSPEEVAGFLNDIHKDAFERLVESF